MSTAPDNFFSRWSRRKLDTGTAVAAPAAPAPAPVPAVQPPVAPATPAAQADPAASRALEAAAAATAAADAPPATGAAAAHAPLPPPTLDDVALLDADSSYSRFVARDVQPEVRNAALKQLFSDPHYNVMDGLDTYIDDYGKPDPLPPGMLRQMVQSKMLGLFDDEDEDKPAADPAAPPPSTQPGPDTPPAPQDALAPPAATAHEDPDLQLQPVDDSGCAGLEPGAGQDPGRQH